MGWRTISQPGGASILLRSRWCVEPLFKIRNTSLKRGNAASRDRLVAFHLEHPLIVALSVAVESIEKLRFDVPYGFENVEDVTFCGGRVAVIFHMSP